NRRIAIVIAGDRKNDRGIILVRLIELGRVGLNLSIIVDNVSKMIEEGGIVIGVCTKLSFHRPGKSFLDLGSVMSSCISNSVKNDLFCFLDATHPSISKNSTQWQCGIDGLRDRHRDKPWKFFANMGR